MIRPGRLRRVYLLGTLLVLAAPLHAPTAYSAPGDPPSGSPAGAVYQLPLEQGRADGAPKGGGGTGGSGGGAGATGGSGSGESTSLYRSENNFGSSSQVPGLAATGDAASGGGGDGNGTAGGGTAGGVSDGVLAGGVADTGNTSVGAGLALLGAIALLAIAVAFLSRRFSR